MIKKKKISELPLAQSLVGLFTIGVDAANRSVKVSLEFIKTAYDNVVKATQDAINATKSANAQASNANTAKLTAEGAAAKATTAARMQSLPQMKLKTQPAKQSLLLTLP